MKTLLALVVALCAAVGARAETLTFLTYDFEFEDGSVLPELRVAYETQGKLDGGRDNAILLLHGTSGDRRATGIPADACGETLLDGDAR